MYDATDRAELMARLAELEPRDLRIIGGLAVAFADGLVEESDPLSIETPEDKDAIERMLEDVGAYAGLDARLAPPNRRSSTMDTTDFDVIAWLGRAAPLMSNDEIAAFEVQVADYLEGSPRPANKDDDPDWDEITNAELLERLALVRGTSYVGTDPTMILTARRLIVVDEGIQAALGPATPEQIEASDNAVLGVIHVDSDGDVVPTGKEQFAGPLRTAWVTEGTPNL